MSTAEAPKPKTRDGAKKKAPSKPKEPKNQQPITGMEDEFEVPEALQSAADKYNEALLEKSRATENFNSRKESLIDAMVKEDIKRVRVLCEGGNERILELDQTMKVKCRKPKKESEEE